MKNSRLISLLRTLSAWEMNHFLDFVHSPFFNKHERVRKLAKYLSEAHPEFEETKIQKAELGKLIFEEKAFDSQALSDLMTYLTRLLEKFLSIRQIMKDDFVLDHHLLKDLEERGMEKAWLRQWKRMSKRAKPSRIQEWHRLHQLEASRFQAAFRWGDRTGGTEVQSLIDPLDQYYLCTRFRYACAQLNRQKLISDLPPLSGMEEVLQLADVIESGQTPLLGAYRRIFQLLQTPENHQLFSQTQDFLQQHHNSLPTSSLKELYAYLMNFCIQQVNQGNDRYRKLLFELYLWQWDKQILLEEGWLSPWDLKNMISLALKLEKYEWADLFLQEVTSRIRPEFRSQAIPYNLAMLYYEQGNPRKALQLLREAEFSDVFYELGTRVLLTKVYLEEGDMEALLSLLQSFEAYLRRPRLISAYQRELYLNLIRFARKIARLQARTLFTYQLVKPTEVQLLLDKIRFQKAVAQRDWLINKCEKILASL